MRITIIKDDGFVSIDREGYAGIDLSGIPENAHAIQWYGEYGEMEIKNDRGQIIENRPITDIEEFLFVVTLWQQAKEQAVENANQTQS